MNTLDFLIFFLLLSSGSFLAPNSDHVDERRKFIDSQMPAKAPSPGDGQGYKIMREGPSPGEGN